jgi:[ribosomal protein S5]-alanine N-acetyltransferase
LFEEAAVLFPVEVPILHASGLMLRPVGEADIPGWFVRASDAEICLLAGDPLAEHIEQGAEWLARTRARFAEGLAIRWAIVLGGAAESVGTISLTLSVPGATTANLGFVLSRSHWGRGLATAAVREVARYAFGPMGLRGIYGEVLVVNAPSRRVMAKLGFHEDPPAPSPEDGEMCVMCRMDAPDRE